MEDKQPDDLNFIQQSVTLDSISARPVHVSTYS